MTTACINTSHHHVGNHVNVTASDAAPVVAAKFSRVVHTRGEAGEKKCSSETVEPKYRKLYYSYKVVYLHYKHWHLTSHVGST